MTLGEKIKQARLEAGLTQRQLCADTITRNMLSQIENGSARPSMQTLQYLAGRLGRSVGWFLEEGATGSPNQDCMADARAAFAGENWEETLRILAQFRQPDAICEAERVLMTNLARMNLAQQALAQERLPYARQLLKEIMPGLYWTPELAQQARLLQSMAGEAVTLSCPDAQLHQLARQTKDARRALALLQAMENPTSASRLLAGQCHVRLGQWEAAIAALQPIEDAFEEQTAPLLEQCYREMGDYKMAYFYACRQKKA